jgi:hypothetical protein
MIAKDKHASLFVRRAADEEKEVDIIDYRPTRRNWSPTLASGCTQKILSPFQTQGVDVIKLFTPVIYGCLQ